MRSRLNLMLTCLFALAGRAPVAARPSECLGVDGVERAVVGLVQTVELRRRLRVRLPPLGRVLDTVRSE